MVYTWGHMSYFPSFFGGACLEKNEKNDSLGYQNSPSFLGYTPLHGIHTSLSMPKRLVFSGFQWTAIQKIKEINQLSHGVSGYTPLHGIHTSLSGGFRGFGVYTPTWYTHVFVHAQKACFFGLSMDCDSKNKRNKSTQSYHQMLRHQTP